MPQVPRVLPPSQDAGPQVSTRPDSMPLQQINPPGAAFGSGTAKSLQKLGGALNDVSGARQEAQEQEDRRRAKLADAEFQKRKREILFGDGTNANSGYYGLRGEAAVSARPAVNQALDKAKREVFGSQTPGVQKHLEPVLAARVQTELEELDRHTAKERVTANQAASDARIQDSLDEAVLYNNNPKRVKQSQALAITEIAAANLGLGDDVVNEKIDEFNTTMHSAIISYRLATGDLSGAVSYFKENKDQINATAFEAIEINIDRTRRRLEAEGSQAETDLQNEFLKALVNGTLTPEDVLASSLEPFGKGSKDTFLKLLKQDPVKIKTDPEVFVDTFNRIHLPDGHPDKITDENDLNGLVGRGLTFEDLNRLRGEVQGRKTSGGLVEKELRNGLIKAARSALTRTDPFTGMRDPKGDEQLQRWMSLFLPEYERQRSQGKTPVELLDPESPDYLGKSISQFQRSQTEMLQDIINANPDLALPEEEEEPGFLDRLFGGGKDPLPQATPKAPARGQVRGRKKAKAPKGFDPASIPIEDQAVNPDTGEVIFLFKGEWLREDGSKVVIQ